MVRGAGSLCSHKTRECEWCEELVLCAVTRRVSVSGVRSWFSVQSQDVMVGWRPMVAKCLVTEYAL